MTLTSNGEVVEESALGCLGKRRSINVENVEVSLIKRGIDETRAIVSATAAIPMSMSFETARRWSGIMVPGGSVVSRRRRDSPAHYMTTDPDDRGEACGRLKG
jgi:hypothetical protein